MPSRLEECSRLATSEKRQSREERGSPTNRGIAGPYSLIPPPDRCCRSRTLPPPPPRRWRRRLDRSLVVVSLLRGLCVPLGSLLQLFFSCNRRCNGQPTHFWFFGRLEIENGTLVISRRYADLNLHLWNGLVIKAHVRTCSGAALEPIGKSSQPIPHTCAPDPSMTG